MFVCRYYRESWHSQQEKLAIELKKEKQIEQIPSGATLVPSVPSFQSLPSSPSSSTAAVLTKKPQSGDKSCGILLGLFGMYQRDADKDRSIPQAKKRMFSLPSPPPKELFPVSFFSFLESIFISNEEDEKEFFESCVECRKTVKEEEEESKDSSLKEECEFIPPYSLLEKLRESEWLCDVMTIVDRERLCGKRRFSSQSQCQEQDQAKVIVKSESESLELPKKEPSSESTCSKSYTHDCLSFSSLILPTSISWRPFVPLLSRSLSEQTIHALDSFLTFFPKPAQVFNMTGVIGRGRRAQEREYKVAYAGIDVISYRSVRDDAFHAQQKIGKSERNPKHTSIGEINADLEKNLFKSLEKPLAPKAGKFSSRRTSIFKELK
ncbi:hypothetical protein ADUPG1_008945 [Aduncisulcus paluster]|uniref:Uncharacterized protein n=1 Tax=Aduncisulcus paluster TaxID=2918883 RepID=A0ABQ5KTU7_9EUKA|nr:hypothetical protein ADUPG1_008945 [Aduncisulcus paluster]